MEAVEKACDTESRESPRNQLASAQSRVAMRQVQVADPLKQIGARRQLIKVDENG
jgi:hypothetical protein